VTAAEPEQLPRDDLAAATLISGERPGELHYLKRSGTWLIWDGRCHRPDFSDSIGRVVAGFGVRGLVTVNSGRADDQAAADRGQVPAAERRALLERWDAPARYYRGLARNPGKNSLVGYLATLCGTDEDLFEDRHPYWLNTASGTVDLRTQLMKPHDPADRLTYCLDLAWKPWLAGRCPGFLGLVNRCAGSGPNAGYLLRCLGYTLLGCNPKRKFFIMKGPTSNGKSTILSVVSQLLGVLAHESSRDLIAVTPHGRNARTENSIRGKRLVRIAETSEAIVLDAAQLKRITGETEISVNQHYAKSEILTAVTWGIWMPTNQMPALPDFDAAIGERLAVVPCDGPPVPEAERDETLADRIVKDEGEAILATLIAACGWVLEHGLMPPASAVQAKYRKMSPRPIHDKCCHFSTFWPRDYARQVVLVSLSFY
jgi:P4 family phage/plasmid primase-like protien